MPADLIDAATGGLRVPGHGVIPPLFHYRTEHGLFVYAPLAAGTGVTAIEWGDDAEDDEDRPVTLDEVRASVHRVLGFDLPIGPPDGDGPHLLRRLRRAATPGSPTGSAPVVYCWSATRRTSTPRSAGPASTSVCRTRSTSAGSSPPSSAAKPMRRCSTATVPNAVRWPRGR